MTKREKFVKLEVPEETARLIMQAIDEKQGDLGKLVSHLLRERQMEAVKPVNKSMTALNDVVTEIREQLTSSEDEE